MSGINGRVYDEEQARQEALRALESAAAQKGQTGQGQTQERPDGLEQLMQGQTMPGQPLQGQTTNGQPGAEQTEPMPGTDGLRQTARVGQVGVIGREEVMKAMSVLKEYQRGKASLDERIKRNEEWYRQRHWEDIGHSKNKGDPEPASAWLLNALLNKHADAMDNYPEPSILPREAGDKDDAEKLSEILPTILEQIDYEGVYDRKWWKKLKGGTAATAVVWNPTAYNGLGEIEIKCVDILSLFWEPGIVDIQDSRNIFRVDIADTEALEMQYPEYKGKLGGKDVTLVEYYNDDTIDTSGKTAVIDWYYKKTLPSGRTVVHYCKMAGGNVLYASENVPEMAECGYYDHGRYPFVLDTLFPVENSPAAFGYLDICKDPQMFIDKLNQAMLKNAMMRSRPRFFVRKDGSVNEQEFADWSKDFVGWTGGSNPSESIMSISVPEMSEYAMTLLQYKVDELKTTSGNTDFGQGVSTSGVTAASAIAALQEAGGKLSRDMIRASYRAFTKECYIVIELIRQFYDVEREFRILGDHGGEQYVRYSNANIKPGGEVNEYGVVTSGRKPVFDIKVRAHKANSFSRLSQNELAKEFYTAGFFNPQNVDQALMCIGMMDFEGKDELERKIAQNGTMYEQMQMMQQQITQMAAMIDKTQGTNLLGTMSGGGAAQSKTAGAFDQKQDNSMAEQHRERAASEATPGEGED